MELRYLFKLKVLNLVYNDVKTRYELERLESLEYFNFSNNSTTLLTGISRSTKLKTLNPSNKKVVDVDELKTLGNEL